MVIYSIPDLLTQREPTEMPSRRLPSPEEALNFVKAKGIVLESAHGRVPTFVDFVAGEPVTRWWGHPKGHSIYALTREIRDSPDILTSRLIDHKVTYVHHRLWPALVQLADEFDEGDLAAIREEHLPGGKHRVTVTEFPKWVPKDVLAESKRLTREEARSLFKQVFL